MGSIILCKADSYREIRTRPRKFWAPTENDKMYIMYVKTSVRCELPHCLLRTVIRRVARIFITRRLRSIIMITSCLTNTWRLQLSQRIPTKYVTGMILIVSVQFANIFKTFDFSDNLYFCDEINSLLHPLQICRTCSYHFQGSPPLTTRERYRINPQTVSLKCHMWSVFCKFWFGKSKKSFRISTWWSLFPINFCLTIIQNGIFSFVYIYRKKYFILQFSTNLLFPCVNWFEGYVPIPEWHT